MRPRSLGAATSAMQTGFWVDNGPTLPVWSRLPVVAFWIVPSVIGVPLLARALANSTRIGDNPRATMAASSSPGPS
jgi:hypothetical protein